MRAPTDSGRSSYLVEVASDAKFASKVFTRDGVAPGSNGRTSVRIPDKLQKDRTYFWRARAQDGANTGPFSTPVKFSIVTPASLAAPTLVSPVNGAKETDPTPQFKLKNASRAGQVGERHLHAPGLVQRILHGPDRDLDVPGARRRGRTDDVSGGSAAAL